MLCPSLLLLFDIDLPQWPSMKSYVIQKVFRIEIEEIIFSRFRNGTDKISGIIFFFSRKSIKFSGSGRFYRVGWKRGNKQYFNFGLIFSSETAWPNQLKLGWKNPWKVLYADYSFSLDSLSNMAATGNSCFWLDEFLKSSLKSLGQMNWDLVGNISVMSSIKIAHFVPIR
jgi:hypothetical protein